MSFWESASAEHDALAKVAEGIAAVAPDGWERVELDYSKASTFGAASMAATVAGKAQWVRTGFSLQRLLDELKQAMYRPETGTWLSTHLVFLPDGSVDAEYNYDDEPQWDVQAAKGLYAAELERFPRSTQHIPEWMRADLDAN